jgi:drug/metabolite transporter (DMT)-like permease
MNLSAHDNKRAVIFALITILFWSTVATAFKIGLVDLDPIQLIFIATATTVVLLFSIILFSGKLSVFKTITLKQLMHHAFLGLLNPVAYYIIIFKAYSLLPAQVAQPINMIWPIVLVLLSVLILGQKINWKSWIALLISFSGVIVISSQGDFSSFAKVNPTGIILCIVSSFVWSFYWIFNSKNTIKDQVLGLFLNFLFGLIFLALITPAFSSFRFKLNTSFWAGIYIGIFEIGISFVFWMKALSLASSSAKIANLIYLAPFLSLIFIHFILGEAIYSTTILGLFFIISGILFQQTHKVKINETEQTPN